MLLNKKNIANGAIIACWKVEESVEELLVMLGNDKELTEQISQFGSEKRKLEFLATRVLLNVVLDDDKKIAYFPSGAPYLKDKSFNISIAHTGGCVVIILHPSKKVGIDIEKISDKVVRIKHKFLSKEELDFVDNSLEKTHLTLLWCAKESLYKIIDVEIIDFVADLRVMPFQPHLEGEIQATETCTPQQKKYTLHYVADTEICCVWTVEN